MEKLPEEITVCKLQCILMPQGEIICGGKTVGWFKDLKPYMERDFENTAELTEIEQTEISRLINSGCTSGRIDGEQNCVAWELCWNKWVI